MGSQHLSSWLWEGDRNPGIALTLGLGVGVDYLILPKAPLPHGHPHTLPPVSP